MDEKTEYLWNTYDLVNKWIEHADTKAAAVLAAVGVFSCFIVTNIKDIVPFISKDHWYVIVASILGCACLIFSALCAFVSILPKLKVGESTSLIYFNHISNHTAEEYKNLLKPVLKSTKKLNSQLTHQIWANSKVSTKKFYRVGLSIWCLAGATLFSLIPLISYVSSLLWPK